MVDNRKEQPERLFGVVTTARRRLVIVICTGRGEGRRCSDEGKPVNVQAPRAQCCAVPEEGQIAWVGLPAVRGVQTHTWLPLPWTSPAAEGTGGGEVEGAGRVDRRGLDGFLRAITQAELRAVEVERPGAGGGVPRQQVFVFALRHRAARDGCAG